MHLGWTGIENNHRHRVCFASVGHNTVLDKQHYTRTGALIARVCACIPLLFQVEMQDNAVRGACGDSESVMPGKLQRVDGPDNARCA